MLQAFILTVIYLTKWPWFSRLFRVPGIGHESIGTHLHWIGNPVERESVYITDGSTPITCDAACWRAAAFHPMTRSLLIKDGTQESAWLESWLQSFGTGGNPNKSMSVVHIFIDSWVIANGLILFFLVNGLKTVTIFRIVSYEAFHVLQLKSLMFQFMPRPPHKKFIFMS